MSELRSGHSHDAGDAFVEKRSSHFVATANGHFSEVSGREHDYVVVVAVVVGEVVVFVCVA